MFTPNPVVDEEDQYGEIETSDNSTVVSVTLASGTGLAGTETATVVHGVATFTNLSDDEAGTIALVFSSGDLAPAISSNIVIQPAAASQLVFIHGPSSTVAGAAMSPAVTVGVEDEFGSLVTTDDSSITLTLSNGTFEGGLKNVTVAAVKGVASFSGLAIDVAGAYTLSATDGFLAPSGPSNSFAISPTSPSKIVFGQQPVDTYAGKVINPAPTVWVEDVYGNLTGDSSPVTVTLSSGSFDGGSNTVTVYAASGVATFSDLTIDAPGDYTLFASDAALTPSGASDPFKIIPPGPASVVFGQQPRDAAAGAAIAPAVTVLIEDALGNLVTSDDSTVTLTLSANRFEGGSTTATAAAFDGIATFANLKIDVAGQYTLSATDGLLNGSGPSRTFAISAAAASAVVFSQNPSNSLSHSAITPPVTVDVVDQYGNLISTDGSTVVLALSAGTFEGGSSTASTTATNGVATFAGLTIDTPGTYTLSASDRGLTPSNPSRSFVVSPLAPDQVVFNQGPVNVVAGAAMRPVVSVDVDDIYGNLVTSNTSVVTLTLGGGTFVGGSNTVAAAAVNGVALFSNLKIDAAGTDTLTATDGSLNGSGEGRVFTVTAAAAAKVVFSQQPASAIAGTAISPVVAIEDQFDNVVSSAGSNVSLTLSSHVFASGQNTATATAIEGIATFVDLVIDAAGTYTLTATDGALGQPLPSVAFAIGPAPGNHFAVTTNFGNPDTAGTKGNLTVQRSTHITILTTLALISISAAST